MLIKNVVLSNIHRYRESGIGGMNQENIAQAENYFYRINPQDKPFHLLRFVSKCSIG